MTLIPWAIAARQGRRIAKLLLEGEDFLITMHGIPVAILRPIAASDRLGFMVNGERVTTLEDTQTIAEEWRTA